jgi:glutamyl-tRNA reductase
MREALKLRNNEPIFMIDIAVPRDIDPRVEEISNIYLYDIDDLRSVTDENMESRRENAKLAEEIVLQTERNFQRWLNGLKVVPTIVKLRNKIEIIKEAELRRALDKLGRDDEKVRIIIESMASGIVGKILHDPLTNLKKESSTSLGALYMDSMQKLFELDTEFKIFEEEEDEADVKDWE